MAHPESLAERRLADRVALSALADGEASAEEAERALAGWARDAALRRDWHDWHRVGDALRSDELARPMVAGDDFLRSLRERLEREPSPWVQARPAPRLGAATALPMADGSLGWRMPAALAAGVAAVAVAVSMLQWPDDQSAAVAVSPVNTSPAATMAASSPGAPAAPGTTAAAVPLRMTPAQVGGPVLAGAQARLPGPVLSGVGGPLIRDPVLDHALREHRGSTGLLPPASSGRVETVGLER